MVEIYQYYDYHKYLYDFYEERKKSDLHFSFRYIGQKTGMDPGYLVKVFQGKKNLTIDIVPKFSEMLKLDARRRDYFELLILFSKAKSNQEIKHYFEKLLSFTEIGSKKVDADSYEFYTKWYYTAVREIIGFCGFDGDYAKLARMTEPSIRPYEAKKAVELLERLGFIVRKPDGTCQLTARFITTGEAWRGIAVRNFQEETMDMAKEALSKIAKEERDISTVTISLSLEGYEKIRERLKSFRKEILDLAYHETNVQRAYQLNLQLFPISKQHSEVRE